MPYDKIKLTPTALAVIGYSCSWSDLKPLDLIVKDKNQTSKSRIKISTNRNKKHDNKT